MSQRLQNNAALLKLLSQTSTPSSLFPTDSHLNTITCPFPSCRAPVTSDWEVHLCPSCPTVMHRHLKAHGTDVRRDSKGIWRGRIKDEAIDWWVEALMGQSGDGRGCRAFRPGRLAGKVRSSRKGEKCLVHGGKMGREVRIVEKEVVKEVVKEVKPKKEKSSKGTQILRVVQQSPMLPLPAQHAYMATPQQSCCHNCCRPITTPLHPHHHAAPMPYDSYYHPPADTYWPIEQSSVSSSSVSDFSDGWSKVGSASSASSVSSSSRSKDTKTVIKRYMYGANPAKKKTEKAKSEIYIPGC